MFKSLLLVGCFTLLNLVNSENPVLNHSVEFIEIYVKTTLEACESRDVKGLYKKARAGEIKNMTGISAPYQVPTHPDLEVVTDEKTIQESVAVIMQFLNTKFN